MGIRYFRRSTGLPFPPLPRDGFYTDKRSGLGPVFTPTGDVERDMAGIKAFYAPIRGKNADQFHAD